VGEIKDDKATPDKMIAYVSHVKIEVDVQTLLDLIELVLEEGGGTSLYDAAKKVKKEKAGTSYAYIAEFILSLYRRKEEGELIPKDLLDRFLNK